MSEKIELKENRNYLESDKEIGQEYSDSNKVQVNTSIFLFILFSSLFTWFYNYYVFKELISIESVWLKIFHTQLFTFSPKFQDFRIFNILFVIGSLIPAFFLRRSIRIYFEKFFRSFKYFGALLQHYSVSFLLIIIVTPAYFNNSFYQEAIWFSGDFIAIPFFILFVLVCLPYKKTPPKEQERASHEPINTLKKDHLGISSIISNLKEEISTPPESPVLTVGLSGAWGSGKTSVFDIIKNEIKKEQEKKSNYKNIRIINVNVHKYEKIDMLYLYLFDELLESLQKEVLLPRLDSFFITKNILEPFLKGFKIDSLLNKVMPLARIENYLKEYSRWLNIFGIKTVCFIDDIDRLHDKKDLDSVLKLLNLVNQNMSNIILFVSYDPDILANLLRKTDAIVDTENSRNVNEIISKYFNKVYFIPHFIPQQLFSLNMKYIHSLITLDKLSERSKEMFGNDFKSTSLNEDLFERSITTSRKYVKFSIVLKRNLKSIKNDINLKDLILMSLIEATNLELFDSIRKNENSLTLSQNSYNDKGTQKVVINSQVIFSRYKKIMQNFNFDNELFFLLFPHYDSIRNFLSDSSNKNFPTSELDSIFMDKYNESIASRRIYNYLLFPKFFFPSNTPPLTTPIISQEIKFDIIDKLSNSFFSKDDAIDLLDPLFPRGFENQHLQDYSIQWLNNLISNQNENSQAKENIILGLSYLVKSNSQKFKSPFTDNQTGYIIPLLDTFILYLALYTAKTISFIKKIIKLNDNSDIFANKVLSISLGEEPPYDKLTNKQRLEIAKAFLSRIDNKLKTAKSIFDEKHFDDITNTIWRWDQAEKYLKKKKSKITIDCSLYSHLHRSIIDNSANFELLFDHPIINYDSLDKKTSFHFEWIEPLLSKKYILEFVSNYLDNENYIIFNEEKIKALKIWFDENNPEIIL